MLRAAIAARRVLAAPPLPRSRVGCWLAQPPLRPLTSSDATRSGARNMSSGGREEPTSAAAAPSAAAAAAASDSVCIYRFAHIKALRALLRVKVLQLGAGVGPLFFSALYSHTSRRAHNWFYLPASPFWLGAILFAGLVALALRLPPGTGTTASAPSREVSRREARSASSASTDRKQTVTHEDELLRKLLSGGEKGAEPRL